MRRGPLRGRWGVSAHCSCGPPRDRCDPRFDGVVSWRQRLILVLPVIVPAALAAAVARRI